MRTISVALLISLSVLHAPQAEANANVGVIGFGNRIAGTSIDAPVLDIDCETRLSGPSFLAQAYVGLTTETLRPLGPVWPFFSAGSAGYIPMHTVYIPGAANQPVYAQLRAWEAAAGPTYEAAVGAGGKHGFSNILPMLAVGNTPGGVPPAPIGLESFCLIPEPSVFALFGCAAAAFALWTGFRRRRGLGDPALASIPTKAPGNWPPRCNRPTLT